MSPWMVPEVVICLPHVCKSACMRAHTHPHTKAKINQMALRWMRIYYTFSMVNFVKCKCNQWLDTPLWVKFPTSVSLIFLLRRWLKEPVSIRWLVLQTHVWEGFTCSHPLSPCFPGPLRSSRVMLPVIYESILDCLKALLALSITLTPKIYLYPHISLSPSLS